MNSGTIRKMRRETVHVEKIMLVPLIDILTILVVFLIASYSLTEFSPSDLLKLPISTAVDSVEMALQVSVSKTEIMIDDRKIVPIVKGRVPNAFKNNILIEPLYEHLKLHAERRRQAFEQHPELAGKFEAKVMVLADRDTPAVTIDEVLYTINQLAFEKFHLLVSRKVFEDSTADTTANTKDNKR